MPLLTKLTGYYRKQNWEPANWELGSLGIGSWGIGVAERDYGSVMILLAEQRFIFRKNAVAVSYLRNIRIIALSKSSASIVQIALIFHNNK